MCEQKDHWPHDAPLAGSAPQPPSRGGRCAGARAADGGRGLRRAELGAGPCGGVRRRPRPGAAPLAAPAPVRRSLLCQREGPACARARRSRCDAAQPLLSTPCVACACCTLASCLLQPRPPLSELLRTADRLACMRPVYACCTLLARGSSTCICSPCRPCMEPAARLPALSGAWPGSLSARGAARARRSPRWATAPARTCGSWRCWAARARRGGAAARTRACPRALLAWPACMTLGSTTAMRPPAVRRLQRTPGRSRGCAGGKALVKKLHARGAFELMNIRTCWMLERRKIVESVGGMVGCGPRHAAKAPGGSGRAARARRRGAAVDHGARGRGRGLCAGRRGAAAAEGVCGAVARAAAGARGRRAARQQAPPRGARLALSFLLFTTGGSARAWAPLRPTSLQRMRPRLPCPCP